MKTLNRDCRTFLIEDVMESEGGVKKVKIRIVTEGLTIMKDKFYTKDSLKRAVENKVFNDIPMFLNHTTPSEEYNRPERDINDKVATIKTTEYKEKNGLGYIVSDAVIHGSPTYEAATLFKWFQDMKKSKTPIEVSQHSYLEGSEGEKNGYPVIIVEDIVAAKSVDYVTAGNAGGFMEALESKKEPEIKKTEGDENTMDLNELKVKHPELYAEAVKTGKETAIKESKTEEVTAENEDLKEKNATLTKEADERKLDIKKDKLMKEALTVIDDSKLHKESKKKITEQLESIAITEDTKSLKADAEGLVKKERAYLESIGVTAVFGNGEGGDEEVAEGGDESVKKTPEEAKEALDDKLSEIEDAKKEKK